MIKSFCQGFADAIKLGVKATLTVGVIGLCATTAPFCFGLGSMLSRIWDE